VSARSMPFVPCTFSPRDVVLQERSRLEPDGSLTVYEKPRVTHNLSKVLRALGGRKHGESMNSAVPAAEKALPGMPTVQQYARAQAICDTAAGLQVIHDGWPECRLRRDFDRFVVHIDTGTHTRDVRPRSPLYPTFEHEPRVPTAADSPRARTYLLRRYTRWLFSDEESALRCVEWARKA